MDAQFAVVDEGHSGSLRVSQGPSGSEDTLWGGILGGQGHSGSKKNGLYRGHPGSKKYEGHSGSGGHSGSSITDNDTGQDVVGAQELKESRAMDEVVISLQISTTDNMG